MYKQIRKSVRRVTGQPRSDASPVNPSDVTYRGRLASMGIWGLNVDAVCIRLSTRTIFHYERECF